MKSRWGLKDVKKTYSGNVAAVKGVSIAIPDGVLVRVPGRATAAPGDRLIIAASPDKLHWFDKDGKTTA